MDQTLKVLLSSDSVEWLTPPRYIEVVRQVLGGIDLDPASTAQANTWIKAERYYTADMDGLSQPWIARTLWLNPPYGKTRNLSNQGIWCTKLIEAYTSGQVQAAIVLVNFVPGYKWFSPLWEYPLCAVDHCIEFVRPDGQRGGKAKASSAFVYLGPDPHSFSKHFSQFGTIIGKTYG